MITGNPLEHIRDIRTVRHVKMRHVKVRHVMKTGTLYDPVALPKMAEERPQVGECGRSGPAWFGDSATRMGPATSETAAGELRSR